jgi:hypothetical protein
MKVTEHERKRIRFEDRESKVLHAIWSRSGSLRLHAASTRSPEAAADIVMELTPDQVEHLERFLHDGP